MTEDKYINPLSTIKEKAVDDPDVIWQYLHDLTIEHNKLKKKCKENYSELKEEIKRLKNGIKIK